MHFNNRQEFFHDYNQNQNRSSMRDYPFPYNPPNYFNYFPNPYYPNPYYPNPYSDNYYPRPYHYYPDPSRQYNYNNEYNGNI